MNNELLWETLKHNLQKKGMPISKVERAYKLANMLHKDQYRKSGEHYIMHPLNVALILEELDFEVDVICSALLHDVVEDCDYTLQQMKKEFGAKVSEIVDSVSAIDKAKYIYDNTDIYESEEFLKSSLEEQTFKKLVALGKKNPLGLYVKFADRLHNLRTISIFPKSKQVEKVKETERWVLPLAKTLNSRYFYDEIKNECFKVMQKDEPFFFEQYSSYHKFNDRSVMDYAEILFESLSKELFAEVKIETIKEYQVFDEINENIKGININKITQGQIMKVPTYKAYLIYKGELKDAINEFFEKQMLVDKDVNVINENIGNISQLPFLKLVDKFKNILCVYFVTKKEYLQHKIGTTCGQNLELLDDINTHKIVTSFIKVRSRSNELIFMPEGSTVLDFAFKIHEDIGLGFKYAIINESKTKQPPFTSLNENDKIEIIVERNEYGEIENRAELKWLAYVETDNAKKILIKNFERKFLE